MLSTYLLVILEYLMISILIVRCSTVNNKILVCLVFKKINFWKYTYIWTIRFILKLNSNLQLNSFYEFWCSKSLTRLNTQIKVCILLVSLTGPEAKFNVSFFNPFQIRPDKYIRFTTESYNSAVDTKTFSNS